MKTIINQSKTYETILVIVIGFLLLSYYPNLGWLVNASIIIGVLSLLSKKLGSYIEWGWNMLAKLLSYIIPNILLSAVFFFLLTPLALLSRINSRNDPLMLKKNYESTFKIRENMITKESFEKQW